MENGLEAIAMLLVPTVQQAFNGLFANVEVSDIERAIRLSGFECPEDTWGELRDDGMLFRTAHYLAKWREESVKEMAMNAQVHSGNFTPLQGDTESDYKLDSNYFYKEYLRLKELAILTQGSDDFVNIGALMT